MYDSEADANRADVITCVGLLSSVPVQGPIICFAVIVLVLYILNQMALKIVFVQLNYNFHHEVTLIPTLWHYTGCVSSKNSFKAAIHKNTAHTLTNCKLGNDVECRMF